MYIIASILAGAKYAPSNRQVTNGWNFENDAFWRHLNFSSWHFKDVMLRAYLLNLNLISDLGQFIYDTYTFLTHFTEFWFTLLFYCVVVSCVCLYNRSLVIYSIFFLLSVMCPIRHLILNVLI